MLIFRLFILVLVALAPLGCCVRTCSVQYAKKSQKMVDIPAATKWRKLPVIQVCDTAPVTKDEVEAVLEEWVAHGAPKLKVINSKCEEPLPSPGYIQVDRWRPDWRLQLMGAHAVTAVWPEDPEAGLIMLPDGNLGVLRHEIGHIWIQGHANKRGHVICPFVDCMGDDWSGVKKAFRRGGY